MPTFEKRVIPYTETGLFNKLMVDYLQQATAVQDFYHRPDRLESYADQIREKSENYSDFHRQTLVTALETQYQGFELTEAVRTNLTALRESHTFTVTTGHQLSLFTGPLYFIYKIVSAINSAKALRIEYPDYQFVPVYWMATEDHDFEEISSLVTTKGKLKWQKQAQGAVGRLDTAGLEQIAKLLESEFNTGKNAQEIAALFKKVYLQATNLAAATRILVNTLFGDTGLIIVDGDDRALKQIFVPFVKRELFEQFSFKAVSQTNEKLKSYAVQVNPREINLFYLTSGLRNRIVKEDQHFRVVDTDIFFSESELQNELQDYPERFSPNVILRPLYEEVILPNLVYIGGAGELAYWLQLKSMFEDAGVTFPILKLRNAAVILQRKQFQKMERLQLDINDLLRSVTDLSNRVAIQSADFPLSLDRERAVVESTFAYLEGLIARTDKSFAGAVAAQKKKQLNGLDKLEKRLLLAQKRKSADEIVRALALRQFVFPFNQFQERILNFSVFYAEFGAAFIDTLLQEFEPFKSELAVFIADS